MQNIGENKMASNTEVIKGITCIYVPVRDVYKSIQWYQKNLGCKSTNHNPVEPGVQKSIMRFPDHTGKLSGPTEKVPAVFLIESQQEGGRLAFTNSHGDRVPVACFITSDIDELFNRLKENGVRIADDIPEGRTCGSNVSFYDLDGNMWEVWQP